MSVVYKARQSNPRRIVALKILLAGIHADAARRARLLAEADAIGRLQHPNIVQIYEVGESDGQLFLSLEYVHGSNLESHLNGKPQDPRLSAALLEKLARAVHYAHENGIVHRDLKPSNILLQASRDEPVTPTSAPKIVDFGLAKQEDVVLTATNAMLGTPAYMAPEQASGNNHSVSPATDVYALGAILYEMLTGRPPFRAATALETLEQVRSTEAVPARQRQANVPLDLSTICSKCLHKSQDQRYGSALELAEDLGRFLSGEPIRARPMGMFGRLWRWGRRRPAWAATLATVVFLVLVIAIGSTILSVYLNSALTSAETEKLHAQEAERQATDKLWEAYFAEARASRLSGHVGQHFDSLRAIRKALQLPTPQRRSLAELRTEAIACLVLPDLDMASAWEAHSSDWHGWEQNLQLEFAVRDDRHGNVSIRRMKDDSEVAQLPNEGPLLWGGLSFSPDRRFVQQRTAKGQFLWDLQGPKPILRVEFNAMTHDHTVAFTPDSKRVAFVAAGDHSIAIFSTESGKPLQTIHTGIRPDRMEFHPQRNELAVSAGHLVRFFDMDTGTQRKVELKHVEMVYSIAWHPKGTILATGCHDQLIRFWNADTGTLARQPLAAHQTPGILMRFSHSGDHLASEDWNGVMRIWDVRTGRQILVLSGNRSSFGPNDRQFVLGASKNRLKILPFTPGQGLLRWALPFAEAQRLGWLYAPLDHDFLIVNSSHGMFLFDWRGGDELSQISISSTRAFAQEGKKAFLTSSTRGILRWPIHEGTQPNHLRIGPPEILMEGATNDLCGGSVDGRVLAIPRYYQATTVWHRPDRWLKLAPREDVRMCAVSPDGRWIATGSHNSVTGIGATVWDATDGRPEKDFHVGGMCPVGFSPENRWLLTRGGGFRLWKVGTWEEGPDLHDEYEGVGWFAFSPDGKTLALTGAMGQVRLLETETGREFVHLTVPEQTKVQPYCFSPDGTRLAAIGSESQLLYIWDLRTLRAGLTELGLDWDQPPYPPAAMPEVGRLHVKIVVE
jgi:WD40 repeat protein/tRNA A-37 threonylcarbamoyl transferase component Bud32